MKKLTETMVREFAQELRDNEKSEATVVKYSAVLCQLMDYLNGEEVTRQGLIAYREHLMETLNSRTVNCSLSAINSWLESVGMADCKVKLLKVQRQMFRPANRELSRDEFDRLINTAKAQKKERLLLMMETICATGIRVSEIRYITEEAARRGKAEIVLKGKIRTILIPKKLCRKLRNYAREKGITSGVIFITRNGTPVSRKQIWAEMKALCEAAGVEATKVFPHNLRHLFARCFYSVTHDITKLADVLGHSSIETTRIYLITSGAEHARTLDRLRLIS